MIFFDLRQFSGTFLITKWRGKGPTLNCLGVLCFHLPQADTEQAMALYQESLQLRYAVLGKDAQTKEIATTVSTKS